MRVTEFSIGSVKISVHSTAPLPKRRVSNDGVCPIATGAEVARLSAHNQLSTATDDDAPPEQEELDAALAAFGLVQRSTSTAPEPENFF